METRDMPEIRFENDYEEWKHRKLEDVAKFSTGECVTGSDCLLHGRFQIIGGGMLPMGYINWKNRNKDTVTIAKIGSAGFVGWQKTDFFLTNNCFSVVPNDEIDSEFLYHNLKQKETEIARMKWQTSIPYISVQSLGDLSVEFPSLPVQREIADLFSSLDRKLAAEQKKLAALKMAKHALLVKIFPREGETVPEIRFEGFSHPWEQRKLGDCFEERNENMPNGELISVTINEGIKKFSELGRHDNSNEDKSKYKKVCVGDIAYNSMRMWQGASGCSPYEGIVSPAYTVLKPKDGTDSKCVSYLFKRQDMVHTFQLNSQGITSDNWNLKFPALSQIEIKLPPEIDEQKKIAAYFTDLDRLITLHQRKCDKLRQAKSALLNQMFV